MSSVEENIRYEMYIQGFKMFFDNPLFGVGLGNIKTHFYSGHFSYSDYNRAVINYGSPVFYLMLSKRVPFSIFILRLFH